MNSGATIDKNVTAKPKPPVKKKKKSKLPFIIAAVVILGAVGYIYTKNKKNEEAAQDVTSMYQYETATRGDISVIVSGSGSIQSKDKASITSKINGDVKQVYVEDGDLVKAGDRLVLLNGSDYELKAAQAEADLTSAKSKLERAQKDAKNYPTEARANLEQARAAVLSAQQKVDSLVKGPTSQDLEQARSSVRERQANYDSTQADYARQKTLFSQGAISKQELESSELKNISAQESLVTAKEKLAALTAKADPDEVAAATSQLNQANANLKLAEQNSKDNLKDDALLQAQAAYQSSKVNYETAKKNLDSIIITAPITGTIWDLAATPGNSVSTQVPVATIVNTDNVYARISVDESDVTKIGVGYKARVTVDAMEGEYFFGNVIRIAPEAASNNGISSYDVDILLKDTQGKIKPGMNCDGEILINQKSNVISVANSAIQEQNGRKTVIVMDGKTPSYRRVQTGLVGDERTEIISGVDEREVVVTNPNVGNDTSTSNQGGIGGNRVMMFGGGGFRR